jgi:hypothetical protein
MTKSQPGEQAARDPPSPTPSREKLVEDLAMLVVFAFRCPSFMESLGKSSRVAARRQSRHLAKEGETNQGSARTPR